MMLNDHCLVLTSKIGRKALCKQLDWLADQNIFSLASFSK
jgi:hypothetical protein